MNQPKRHANADKPATHVVARARSASLREPYISDHPPALSKPAWHPKADVWAPLPGTTPVTLDDQKGCKWPIGDRHPFLYCNAEISHGPYCSAHAAMAKPKPQGDPR